MANKADSTETEGKAKKKVDKSKMSFTERALHIGGLIDSTPVKVPRLSTGSMLLDDYLDGGFPRGDVSELWGGNNTGKTSTALIAASQPDVSTAWFNVEGQTTLKEWALRLGVDLSRFIELQFNTAEQYAEMIVEAIRSKSFDYVVVDSVAMMASKAELELDLQDKSITQMGMSAKLFTLLMRLMGSAMVGNTRTHVILINQLRSGLGQYVPDNSPGGNALHHKPCFRLKFKRLDEDWEDGDEKMNLRQIGIKLAMTKSKAATFKGGDLIFPVTFLPNGDVRVDTIDECFTLAERYGLFRNAKGDVWGGTGNCTYLGEVLGNGRTAARLGLRSSPVTFEALYQEVTDIINGTRQPATDRPAVDNPAEEPEFDGEFAAEREVERF